MSQWVYINEFLSQWVGEWVSAQVSKFKAQFRCHASAMQNLIAIRYDYGPTLCKFSIYWNVLGAYFEMKNYFYDSPAVMQSGQITSVWFMNSVWHGRGMTSESLLSQSHVAQQSWLNSILLNLVKKVWFRFRASAVLLYNLIPVFSLVWQKHDVWAGPQLVSPLNQCFYCHLTGTITLQALLLHPCKESECAFSPFMIW